jgi:calcium channel MID1
MQFPKLTPLQSRFLACLGTSVLLVIIYYSLSPAHFAYAAEIPLDTTHNEDHNHRRLVGLSPDFAPDVGWEERLAGVGVEEVDVEERGEWDREVAGYQAEFFGADRSIIGRAPLDTVSLQNTVPSKLNVQAGQTNYYSFENISALVPLAGNNGDDIMSNVTGAGTLVKRLLGLDYEPKGYPEEKYEEYEENVNGSKELRLRKRETTRQVYITINTCLQPDSNGTVVNNMPQLTLYVSTSDSNQKPGPEANDPQQAAIPLVQGYAKATVNATNNVFIGVSAPTVDNTTFKTNVWNYEVSASIDAPYFYYNGSQQLFLHYIDSDSTAALLTTGNLTDLNATEALKQQWMGMSSPFSLYVFNKTDHRIEGVRNSYCALSMLQMNPIAVNGTMTRRGFNAIPKEQFYVEGLNPGSNYTAMLGYSGSNLSQVWNAKDFQTKSGKLYHPSNILPKKLIPSYRR